MADVSAKRSLLKIGVIVFLIGLAVNIVFTQTGIHGLLRELSRLTTLVGLGLIIAGFVMRIFKKSTLVKR